MKTHEFDAVSFISGLLITAIGVLYLIPRDIGDIVDVFVDAGTWFFPVLFLAIGAAVITTALMPSRRKTQEDEESV